MTKTMQSLALDDIVIDEDLDFRTDKDAGVDELAASIEAFGLMQPITVAQANGDGKFHVVAGRRRLRAFQQLGRTEIDAIVDDELHSEQAQMIGQIIENLQREDVGPLDEARAFAKLGDYDMKQKDIAAALGVSTSHVSGRLALLKLPDKIVDSVLKGNTSIAAATKLARAPKAVRDRLADKSFVDERAIAQAESEYKQEKLRTDVVDALTAAGVAAAASTESWGYHPADKMADQIGLTDEDKPKSHEWTVAGYEHLANHDDVDAFVAAVASAKAKGVFISGTTGSLKATLVDSANLDKARKADEEERRQVAEERAAAAQMRAEAFERALAPIIASPDKATLITHVLTDHLSDLLSGYGNVLGTILDTAERLGLTLTQPNLAEGEGGSQATEVEHYRNQVLAAATKDSTMLVKAIIAAQKSVTPLLLEQGWIDQGGTLDSVAPHNQLSYLRRGLVTEDDLTDEAKEVLAKERAYEELDEEREDEIDERLQAELDRQADEDPDFEPTEEEIAAMREEIAGAWDADHAEDPV